MASEETDPKESGGTGAGGGIPLCCDCLPLGGCQVLYPVGGYAGHTQDPISGDPLEEASVILCREDSVCRKD